MRVGVCIAVSGLVACGGPADTESTSNGAASAQDVEALAARVEALERLVTAQAAQLESQAQQLDALVDTLDASSDATDSRLSELEATDAALANTGTGSLSTETWRASGTLGTYVTYGSEITPVEVAGASLTFVPTHDGPVLLHSTLTAYSTAPSTGYFPCQGTAHVRLRDASGAYQESDPQRMYAAIAVDASVFEVLAGETYTVAWFYTVTDAAGSYACTYQRYEYEALAFAAE
jgi:hypothetical protein